MHILLILILTCFFANRSLGTIAITKIVVREPRQNDIGLIFDVTVSNTEASVKEMLEYRIRSDGTCCINLTSSSMMRDASRIVGGNFGYIEAGKAETVSLIWPTVSLYNRVGLCPIIVTSTNPQNEQVQFKQILRFDTRFEALDPDSRTLRKHKDFMDCNNWDKDYFKNCTPVICEERYFGLRSFYNHTSEHCEEVPPCRGPHEVYDPWANECIDSEHFCNEEDLEKIRRGEYEHNFLELNTATPDRPNVVVNTCHKNRDDDASKVNAVRRDLNSFSRLPNEDGEISSTQRLWGLANGLFLVFATIVIYGFICFFIYLIVSWISRRSFRGSGCTSTCLMKTPTNSEHVILTSSSLLSHR